MTVFNYDYYRITGKERKFMCGHKNIILSHGLKYIYFCRKVQATKSKLLKFFYLIKKRKMSLKFGLEFNTNNIGKGLYISHAFNITINPKAILGENINLHKGVTIGQENRGSRKGSPNIGNFVWIGANATIVGNIKIGDNVLIAPNSFVNFDVPNNSLVIGNPAKIISNTNATKEYISNVLQINN